MNSSKLKIRPIKICTNSNSNPSLTNQLRQKTINQLELFYSFIYIKNYISLSQL